MKTTDFSSTVTSTFLNENMFKKFGTKIDFNKYTREDLENYRNLLRTKVNHLETSAGFNDLLANEGYQRDKFMLNLLNTKIKEMLGESKMVAELKKKEGIDMNTTETVDKKKFAKLAPPKNKVTYADKIAGAKKKDGKVKEAAVKTDKPWTDKSGKQQSGMAVKGDKYTGKDAEKDAKEKKVKEAAVKTDKPWTDKSGKQQSGMAVKGDKYTGKDAEKEEKSKNKKIKEGIRRAHQYIIIEGLKRMINEDEEGKAKDITAGTDMVNDFTSWMQRVGQYQTKSMIELADSIRANFGQAEADAFKAAITPALQEALSSLTQSRESITRAVAVLAGEESAQAPMGMNGLGGLGVDDELSDPASMDSMNPSDEFGASDAATGGDVTAGRGLRESRQMARASKLAEAHSVMSKLSK